MKIFFISLSLVSGCPAQINWLVRASPTTESIRTLAFGNGVFIASDARPLRSTDGITWTRPQWAGAGNVGDVFYIGSRFLGLGYGYYWLSNPDGTAGTRYALSGFSTDLLADVAVVNGVALVTGTFHNEFIGPMRLAPGSTAMEEVASFPSSSGIDWVISTGSEFLASSNGAIYVSTDGLGWSLRYRGFIQLKPLLHGGVLYGSGKFSVDYGVTWKSNAAPYTPLVFGGGYFLTLPSGQPSTSLDGISWAQRESGTTDPLHVIAFGNNTFVAAGQNGRIITSTAATATPPLVAPSLTTVPSISMKWPSVSGRWYEVESSPDLTAWTKTGELIPGSGKEMIRSFEQSAAKRYFRVTVR